MIFLIVLLFLLTYNPVFAVPTVVINSVPDVVTAGNTFLVTFTVTEASSSSSYYYKFFGGLDTDVYKITNSSDLSYSSSWSNFPQITLNPSSQNIFNTFAFVKSDASTGTFNLKIRLALTSDTNSKFGATSPSFQMEVVAAPPTPTPTSTPIPTSTPTKNPTITPTLKPSLTPTIAVSLTPTLFLETETEQIIPSDSPIPTVGEVLGENTVKSKSNFLSLLFIISGGVLLLTPLIISKIKKHEDEEIN